MKKKLPKSWKQLLFDLQSEKEKEDEKENKFLIDLDHEFKDYKD